MDELAVLGHVIDDKGIRMDPAKVDQVANWKTPTNKSLVASFIGSVGYLAPGCKNVRVDMSVLSSVAALGKPWKWSFTEQRAFENVKAIVHKWRNTRRVSVNYSPDAELCNLCCDASFTGGSGVFSQGNDYQKANVIAFWSGKFNAAQQNYPVHEQELLAIVESLKRFSHLLQGLKFRIYTDHKGLEWITTQKKLSPRQARWLEVLSEFDFEIIHIPGVDNILADSLSRMYSDDHPGTVRAPSEYVGVEEENAPSKLLLNLVTAPLYIGEPLQLLASSLPVREPSTRIKSQNAWRLRDEQIAAKPVAKKAVLKKRVTEDVVGPKRPVGRPKGSKKVAVSKEPPLEVLEGERHTQITPESESEMPTARIIDPASTDEEVASKDLLTDLPEAAKSGAELSHFDHNSRLTSVQDSNIAQDILTDSAITLTDLLHSGDPTIDIYASITNKYSEDPFFKVILSQPANFKNFDVSNGLIFLKSNEKKILCVPDVIINQRRVREILISHAHSLLAHLGTRKTVIYLRESVWWKGMGNDVQAFCDSCPTCATSKPSTQSPYGLLETLEVPTYPWETIGIDFVGPLPISTNLTGSYDMILVVICHLTSMVHLIPTKTTYRAKDVAEVMFDRVYKHHGMPKNIVSDRDSLFTSTFWKRLNELTGTELRMSSSFHPQSDGATERANRTMTQMLRQCVEPGQSNWLIKLPAIEFAMNSASSQTTGYAPFVLNNGRMPRSMLWNAESEFPGVRRFAQQTRDAILAAHDSIIAARVKQTVLANKKRRQAPFTKGDFVYLSTKNLSLPKGRARKLAPKFIGPYRITEDHKNNSFKLDLPSELKRRGVHPSFHASLLRIHNPNDDKRFPGRQVNQISGLGQTEEWAVDRIKTHQGKGRESLFLLVWKSGDKAWVPLSEVKDLEALPAYLEAEGEDKIEDLRFKNGRTQTLPLAGVRMLSDPIGGTTFLGVNLGTTLIESRSSLRHAQSDIQARQIKDAAEIHLIRARCDCLKAEAALLIHQSHSPLQNSPPLNVAMSPPQSSQFEATSRRIIAHNMVNGKLTPSNFSVPSSVAHFLANSPDAFGMNPVKDGYKYMRQLTYNVSDGTTVLLSVPCERPPSCDDARKCLITRSCNIDRELNHCTATAVNTSEHVVKNCPYRVERGPTVSGPDSPDHFHLVCSLCGKTFIKRIFACYRCKHPLGLPLHSALVNNQGCGFVYKPHDLVRGSHYAFVNLPLRQLAFFKCDECCGDDDADVVEIPCQFCKTNGPPKHGEDGRLKELLDSLEAKRKADAARVSASEEKDDGEDKAGKSIPLSYTSSRDIRTCSTPSRDPRNPPFKVSKPFIPGLNKPAPTGPKYVRMDHCNKPAAPTPKYERFPKHERRRPLEPVVRQPHGGSWRSPLPRPPPPPRRGFPNPLAQPFVPSGNYFPGGPGAPMLVPNAAPAMARKPIVIRAPTRYQAAAAIANAKVKPLSSARYEQIADIIKRLEGKPRGLCRPTLFAADEAPHEFC